MSRTPRVRHEASHHLPSAVIRDTDFAFFPLRCVFPLQSLLHCEACPAFLQKMEGTGNPIPCLLQGSFVHEVWHEIRCYKKTSERISFAFYGPFFREVREIFLHPSSSSSPPAGGTSRYIVCLTADRQEPLVMIVR